MEPQANIALLQQLKTGNLRALEQVYARFQRQLLAKALYLLKDEAAAEDLVQTFFIEFWQKQLYQQIEESLEAYLFRAVHNRCLNEIKRLQRLQHRAEAYLQELDEAEEAKEPEIGEDKDSIMALLHTLPPQKQEVVNLIVLEDKKYQEAADIMGISINTVKTHLKIALKQLREMAKKKSGCITRS